MLVVLFNAVKVESVPLNSSEISRAVGARWSSPGLIRGGGDRGRTVYPRTCWTY
jgi:hypothetical protein